MSAKFSNEATMTDARRIMIEHQIENDRKIVAIYQKRASIRDFEDENRIEQYGGFDEEKTLSFANRFTNEDLIDHTISMKRFEGFQITSLENAFMNCTELTDIDLSDLNLDFCTSFKRCFSGCTSLRTVTFGHQCTMNVKDMSDMFYNCKSLINIDTGGNAKNQLDWNTKNVIDFSNMFCNCESLTDLQLDSFDTSSAMRTCKMFMNCKRLSELKVGHFKLNNCSDASFMFAGCQEFKYLDMENFSFHDGCMLRNMFYQCETLQYINLSKWRMNVQDISSMFENCRCLETLDFSNVNISKCFDLSNMLTDCESLISLKVPPGLVNSGTSMVRICSNCSSLPSIDIRSQYASDVREMYRNCKSMKEIKIYDHQFDNVKNMDDIFSGCVALTVLDLSKQNCSPDTASRAFSGCKNLEVLDISGIDLSNTDVTSIFDGLISLQLLVLKEIPDKYYVHEGYLYIDGRQFRMIKEFRRNNGILKVSFADDVNM